MFVYYSGNWGATSTGSERSDGELHVGRTMRTVRVEELELISTLQSIATASRRNAGLCVLWTVAAGNSREPQGLLYDAGRFTTDCRQPPFPALSSASPSNFPNFRNACIVDRITADFVPSEYFLRQKFSAVTDGAHMDLLGTQHCPDLPSFVVIFCSSSLTLSL